MVCPPLEASLSLGVMGVRKEGLDEEEETLWTDWLGQLLEACPLTAAQFELVAEFC